MACGPVSPACSARFQQFLRSMSASRPRTYAVAVRRGSTRPKWAAIRLIKSLKVTIQPSGSTLSATAITRSSDVFTNSE
jgi:hypothetical protein